jgi:hypothetical protein
MLISKSRPGRGFGNVSIVVLDITEKSVAPGRFFLGNRVDTLAGAR